MVMASVGFLSDVEEIIAGTESPHNSSAEAARKVQASFLPEKIRVIHGGTFFEDLTSHVSKDVQAGVGGLLRKIATGKSTWPSLTALVYMGTTNFGIDLETADAKVALTSATLGEIPNSLPFHNNAHYRKVLMSIIRQVAIHNDLYRDTKWELGARDIALLMTAANIHDFMHDGNETGEHPLRLERQSFDLAKPFLIEAGADEDFLKDLETIVLSTYVRPFGQPEAPSNQMKAAYRHYFDGQGAAPELSDDMKRLHDNPKLCLMAALFHEADLMPSLVFGYTQAKAEHMAFSEEAGLTPSPEAQINFMKSVADGFITKAGQANSENFDTTLQAFKQDLDAGIKDYNQAAAVPLPDAGYPIKRSTSPN